MTNVISRELRDNTGAILDRVAAGEEVAITVDARVVAMLRPADPRPRFMRRAQFLAMFGARPRQDAGNSRLMR
jgi:prevent-host-death family protein